MKPPARRVVRTQNLEKKMANEGKEGYHLENSPVGQDHDRRFFRVRPRDFGYFSTTLLLCEPMPVKLSNPV